MSEKKFNLIVDLSFEFALLIIKHCSELQENRDFIISRQLLKSGTSIGANIREAQNAESKKDFVHKIKIAAKEAEETEYWIDLCNHSEHLKGHSELKDKVIVIKKILNKIIGSSKRNI